MFSTVRTLSVHWVVRNLGYRCALVLRPDSGVALDVGNQLAALGRQDEALAYYDMTVRLYPDSAGAHFNRGNVLKAKKRYREAIAAYQQGLKYTPNAQAHHSIGFILANQLPPRDRNFDEAAMHFKQALRLAPNSWVTHDALGVIPGPAENEAFSRRRL